MKDCILIIELMELISKSAVMKFQKDFFKQILGINIDTYLAPILANIHVYGYVGREINSDL